MMISGMVYEMVPHSFGLLAGKKSSSDFWVWILTRPGFKLKNSTFRKRRSQKNMIPGFEQFNYRWKTGNAIVMEGLNFRQFHGVSRSFTEAFVGSVRMLGLLGRLLLGATGSVACPDYLYQQMLHPTHLLQKTAPM